MEIKTSSPSQTQKIAQNLTKNLKGGDVIALYGDLGSGKTVFVQGLAKGLGIKKRILSPTFVLLRSYPIKNQSLLFHHLDLYRIESSKDLKTLDLPQIFSKNSIVAIEWAEKIKKILPRARIDVTIERANETTRKIKITSPPMSFPRKRESKNWIPDQVGNDKDINRAVEILKSGGVVIFPTDTVYGIGCRFDNRQAINRIYQIKGTPKNQPFPILVLRISQVAKIAHINDLAKKLMQKYWPGGLTVILQGKNTEKKYGFRMPNSDLVRSLIKKVGPLVGTSANFHGRGSVISSKDLDPKLTEQVDYILQGKCEVGVESTVVDATIEPIKIIRQGAIKL